MLSCKADADNMFKDDIMLSIWNFPFTKLSLLNTFLIIVCGNFRIPCKCAVDNRSTM